MFGGGGGGGSSVKGILMPRYDDETRKNEIRKIVEESLEKGLYSFCYDSSDNLVIVFEANKKLSKDYEEEQKKRNEEYAHFTPFFRDKVAAEYKKRMERYKESLKKLEIQDED